MHDHHELVLVTSASVIKQVNNGNTLEISGPCILVNRAGSFHEVVQVSRADYHSHVLFFHPQVLDGLPEEMLFRGQLLSSDLTAMSVTSGQMQELLSLATMLRDRPYSQQRPLLLAVFALLGQFFQEGSPYHFTADRNYIFDVIDLLRSNQHVTLSQLASRFHVCQTKLKADFKHVTGLPVMAYRNQLRLEKARFLLESADLPQSQVAYQCGFADESYFIRAFRKKYHVTPAVYRKSTKTTDK